MSTGDLEKTSYAWKKIAEDWENYFTTPSRPSSQEIDKYKEWVSKISDSSQATPPRGLVLGATPELRDALFAAKASVHSLDINLEMLLAMTELLTHANPKEVLVRASWLESPLESNYFNMVLGDAVFPNVPWESRAQFYKEITRMLARGAYFINRAFFVPSDKPFTDIQAVFAKYESRKTSYKTATELVFDIHILTYDPRDHQGSMAKVKEALAPLRGTNGFSTNSESLNKTLDIVWNNWLGSAADKLWFYPYQQEEEAEYARYFEIEDRFAASDHPHGSLTPMYLLRKK